VKERQTTGVSESKIQRVESEEAGASDRRYLWGSLATACCMIYCTLWGLWPLVTYEASRGVWDAEAGTVSWSKRKGTEEVWCLTIRSGSTTLRCSQDVGVAESDS